MSVHYTMLPFVASLVMGCQSSEPFARAYQIGDLTEAIGGPKALAQPGDFVIENDKVRFAILGPRPSMGPHTSGASLVDADLQRNDPAYSSGQGNDQLAELFPTVNLNVQTATEENGEVVIINDGADGGAAVICTEGPEQSFLFLLDGLWALLGEPTMRLRTDYTLTPGLGALHIRTTAVFTDSPEDSACDRTWEEIGSVAAATSEDSLPLLEWALESGLAIGDFYLQGGSIDVFTPGVGFDEAGFLDELMTDGVNTFSDPIVVDYIAGTGDGVSYAIMPDQGRLFVPMFTSSQTVTIGAGQDGNGTSERFDAGSALHYDRWLSVGHGDVGSAVDAWMDATQQPYGVVEGWVLEAGTGTPVSDIHVFAYKEDADAPWLEWTTDVGADLHLDGSFSGKLPPGNWDLVVHEEGRPTGPAIPITVTEGSTQTIVLEAERSGTVRYTVVDETGSLVPAKVSFFCSDGGTIRDPVLGDGFIAGSPAQVSFSSTGAGELILPPGEFYAVASRGIEYEIDISEPFTVDEHSVVDLDLHVLRSVDTSGWISADFHVHAEKSQDSGVSLYGRITTMVSEGVEYLSSSDHDYITDYSPVIAEMGMGDWINSTVGLEVTTIELGHFLGFPLMVDHLADAGGALDWTNLEAQEIIDGIRDLGIPEVVDPVVFVAHPRDGILGYFDQFGMNPYMDDNGDALIAPGTLSLFNPLISAEQYSDDFDAMEVLNGKRFELIRTPTQTEMSGYESDENSVSVAEMISRTAEEQEALISGDESLGYGMRGTVDDWFTLLNLGYRITALGNSDTHGKTTTESGCPRNYIQAETDDPAFFDEVSLAEAVREGRVITTYGPFIRFYANDIENGPGATVTGSEQVRLFIEVQSPSWFDVSQVELYENGTLVDSWDIQTPNDSVINFEIATDRTITDDAWYVVVALGTDDDLSPVFTPVEIAPIQLQDVVSDALSGVDAVATLLDSAVPIPRTFPIYPYGLTNPIWVDIDGDGFDAPGIPEWWIEPLAPEER